MWSVVVDVTVNVRMFGPVDDVVLVLERRIGPVLQSDVVAHDVDNAVGTLLQWVDRGRSVAVWPVDQDALTNDKV